MSLKQASILIIFLTLIFILQHSESANGVPELTSGRVYYQNVTLITSNWEVALVELDFDEDLYLNQALLCPFADQGCGTPPSCRVCDWTVPRPSSECTPDVFAGCCGLDGPDAADPDNLHEWCAPALSFETIEIDPSASLPLVARSSTVALAAE